MAATPAEDQSDELIDLTRAGDAPTHARARHHEAQDVKRAASTGDPECEHHAKENGDCGPQDRVRPMLNRRMVLEKPAPFAEGISACLEIEHGHNLGRRIGGQAAKA